MKVNQKKCVYLTYYDKRNKTTTNIPYFSDKLFDEINQEKAKLKTKLKEAPLPIHLKKSIAIKEMQKSANGLEQSIDKEKKNRDELSGKLSEIQNRKHGEYSIKDFKHIINDGIDGKAKLIKDWERAKKLRQNFLLVKTAAPAAQPAVERTVSPLVERYPDLEVMNNWPTEIQILARGQINQLVSVEDTITIKEQK